MAVTCIEIAESLQLPIFARQPCKAVEICAEGVIWAKSGMGSCFCTAASCVHVQNTPKPLSRKRDMGCR